MLTIFAIPKPFRGHIGTIQRNAIHSWSLLRPRCEIILCADEPGTAQVSTEFGAGHLPDIALNEYGTPLLSSTFEQVVRMAKHPLLCYVNADIVLMDDFLAAVRRIPFARFLMTGRRWDVDIAELWDFSRPDWEQRLRDFAFGHGQPHDGGGMDYYVFAPDGRIENLPPFAVGRPGWDHWFVYRARVELGIPVIDVSRAVQVFHQNHGYGHVPGRRGHKWVGPEGDRNVELRGEADHKLSLWDVTHAMTPTELVSARKVLVAERGYRFYLSRRFNTLPTVLPVTKPLVRLAMRLVSKIRGAQGADDP